MVSFMLLSSIAMRMCVGRCMCVLRCRCTRCVVESLDVMHVLHVRADVSARRVDILRVVGSGRHYALEPLMQSRVRTLGEHVGDGLQLAGCDRAVRCSNGG